MVLPETSSKFKLCGESVTRADFRAPVRGRYSFLLRSVFAHLSSGLLMSKGTGVGATDGAVLGALLGALEGAIEGTGVGLGLGWNVGVYAMARVGDKTGREESGVRCRP